MTGVCHRAWQWAACSEPLGLEGKQDMQPVGGTWPLGSGWDMGGDGGGRATPEHPRRQGQVAGLDDRQRARGRWGRSGTNGLLACCQAGRGARTRGPCGRLPDLRSSECSPPGVGQGREHRWRGGTLRPGVGAARQKRRNQASRPALREEAASLALTHSRDLHAER